jgi:flagellar hook-length control protein FliK
MTACAPNELGREMTDIVANFAPTPLPAANAGARAPNEPAPGDDFTDMLAEFEATPEKTTLLPEQALPSVAAQALSTADLAAQLQSLSGEPLDPALAALLATLQVHVQPTVPPTASPSAIGLRGTLPLQDHVPGTAAANVGEPASLLNAGPRPQQNAPQLEPVAAAKAASTLPQGEVPSAPSNGDAATPALPNRTDAAAPSSIQPFAAAPAPVLPTLIDAQTMSATVAAAPQTAVPLDTLAVHIARKFEGGSSQFDIRLHPAELGRLDISLTVAEDGRVQAVLRAERAETLDILQRDARVLEQQLRQAGLEVGSNALSFSLSSGNGQRQAPFVGWPAFAEAQDAGAVEQDAASTYFAVAKRDGVDIRV